MSRRQPLDEPEPGFVRSRARTPRNPLPERAAAGDGDEAADRAGMSHDDLVAALRAMDALRDVGTDAHPNFQFRGQPFLHFHDHAGEVFADVRLGRGDFERTWASNPQERAELLDRVRRHVDRVDRARKPRRSRDDRR